MIFYFVPLRMTGKKRLIEIKQEKNGENILLKNKEKSNLIRKSLYLIEMKEKNL